MRLIKITLAVVVMLVFSVSGVTTMAADKKTTKKPANQAGQWCVIKYQTKDKKTICKVVECKSKTPKTVAGPFKNKDAATKAKEKACPPAKKK